MGPKYQSSVEENRILILQFFFFPPFFSFSPSFPSPRQTSLHCLLGPQEIGTISFIFPFFFFFAFPIYSCPQKYLRNAIDLICCISEAFRALFFFPLFLVPSNSPSYGPPSLFSFFFPFFFFIPFPNPWQLEYARN